MSEWIALVDCNNFYVSCERLFNPKLRNRPVLVLSNNDGCVVSRSQEVKDLGIKMGTPLFEIESLCRKNKVAIFSSNYALYGDISRRVMKRLARFSPEMEIYSIDECFLNLDGFRNPADIAKAIRKDIATTIGIPVCVGVAQTKTLAKFANHIAKKQKEHEGVYFLNDLSASNIEKNFEAIDVSNVWGIGRQLSAQLSAIGIKTVNDFRRADAKQLRRKFGVVIERIHSELNGIACSGLEITPEAKKQIVSSRSFGEDVYSFEELHASIAMHVNLATEKLRKQNGKAIGITVFVATNRHKEVPQYNRSIFVPIALPSSDSIVFQKAAAQGLKRIYKTGFGFKRAGVMFPEIQDAMNAVTYDLFDVSADRPELMKVLDCINVKWGGGTVKSSAELTGLGWKMRRQRRSPCYTTDWGQLPVV